MTSLSCISCGHSVTRPWLEGCRDLYLHTPFVVNYKVCPNCHLVQQIPTPADTSSFYPSSYPMHAPRGTFLGLARSIMVRRVYYVPPSAAKDDVLLDFGCGDGSYLQSVRSRVGRIIGFEFSPQQAARLKADLGCEVYSDLDKASEELAGQVDIVTGHFVLEHLSDLHAAFRFWGHVLKPGGTLHVAVPNIRSWEARLFGKKWHGLDPPRHISFPEEESLFSLMDEHGFKLAGKRYGIFPNTLAASMATVLAGKYHHVLFLALIPLGFILSCLMPQGTSVYEMRKSC